MKKERLKNGDKVMISSELTGCGVLYGYVTKIEDFFGRNLISVRYDAESITKVNGIKGVSGYEQHFALIKDN